MMGGTKQGNYWSEITESQKQGTDRGPKAIGWIHTEASGMSDRGQEPTTQSALK